MSADRLFSAQRLARLAIQSLAVLVSILTAFAIDAGWDRYQAAQEERASLERLLAEFEGNRAELDFVGQRHLMLHDYGIALLEVGYGLAQPTDESAEQLRTVLGMSVYFDPSTGALNRFLANQQSGLIASPELRDRIAGYPAKVDELWQQERMLRDLIAARIEPHIIGEADRLLLLPPATSSEALQTLRRLLEQPDDRARLIASVREQDVRNLISSRVILEAQSLLKYEKVETEFSEIVAGLRVALGRAGSS